MIIYNIITVISFISLFYYFFPNVLLSEISLNFLYTVTAFSNAVWLLYIIFQAGWKSYEIFAICFWILFTFSSCQSSERAVSMCLSLILSVDDVMWWPFATIDSFAVTMPPKEEGPSALLWCRIVLDSVTIVHMSNCAGSVCYEPASLVLAMGSLSFSFLKSCKDAWEGWWTIITSIDMKSLLLLRDIYPQTLFILYKHLSWTCHTLSHKSYDEDFTFTVA